MAKSRSLTRNQNHDLDDDHASSSREKKSKSFDKGDVAAGSDLNHDVLLLVMMHLGFVDYFAFSGVCKSWRSLALSSRNRFMASKPPMSIYRNDDGHCYLEDFEKRRFKSILPHSADRICSGVTCGYLILMGKETHDFWLVNPITRHQLHFPDCPLLVGAIARDVSIRAILVFSPSISAWVFVVLYNKYWWTTPKLSFYIDGEKGWNHVSSTLPILDIHYFKGKIYTLHNDCSVGELRLYPNRKRKWTLLKPKNFPEHKLSYPELVSSGDNLYVISRCNSDPKKVMELDIGEMKWVLPQKTMEEYAFFFSSNDKSSAAMKLESCPGPQTQFEGYAHFIDDDKSRKCMFYNKSLWYFPHDCLTVNILDE